MYVCSALARAGKSVLLLDSTESYGGSWATLSGPDYVHSIITRHLEHQLAAKQQQQQDAPHQECAGSSSSSSSTASSIALRAVQPLAGASGVSLYTHPDVEQALENKQLLMDLAPRVRGSRAL
jgi:RAB protein geranylgeranyltransferase component A